jgi:hypothetical protein
VGVKGVNLSHGISGIDLSHIAILLVYANSPHFRTAAEQRLEIEILIWLNYEGVVNEPRLTHPVKIFSNVTIADTHGWI